MWTSKKKPLWQKILRKRSMTGIHLICFSLTEENREKWQHWQMAQKQWQSGLEEAEDEMQNHPLAQSKQLNYCVGKRRWGNHRWKYRGWRAKQVVGHYEQIREILCSVHIYTSEDKNTFLKYVKWDFKESTTDVWRHTWQWWQAIGKDWAATLGHSQSHLQRSDFGAKVIPVVWLWFCLFVCF